MKVSLRHLRLVLAVAETRSITRAALRFHLSQPAATAALSRIEARLGTPVFERHPHGLCPTDAGAAILLRIRRALALLDPALHDLAPRLVLTVTSAQLRALVGVVETESFSAAARRLGVSQPTVHRAIGQIEGEAGHALFDRTRHGVIARKPVRSLATATRLAFAELDQALSDLGDLAGRDVGRIVIGAMPLSRALLLGPAIAAFRQRHRAMPLRVIEGPYSDLVLGLRRGEIDFLVGALRPATEDLEQVELFRDEMTIVARAGHPLCRGVVPGLDDLLAQPWVVSPEGTPARQFFAAMFRGAGRAEPVSLVETGSMMLMLDLLARTDHLGFVSALQVTGDIATGRLARVAFRPEGTARPIGLTMRRGWRATRAQGEMISAIHAAATAATACGTRADHAGPPRLSPA